MSKVYKVKNENNKDYLISSLLQLIVGIIVYASVLSIASHLFEGMYIENFWYALVAALILSLLNLIIKPVLIYLTMPLNILTFGITYPIVNVIVLKLCSILMGEKFILEGFFASFVIVIFISLLKIILDNLITKKVGGN